MILDYYDTVYPIKNSSCKVPLQYELFGNTWRLLLHVKEFLYKNSSLLQNYVMDLFFSTCVMGDFWQACCQRDFVVLNLHFDQIECPFSYETWRENE